LRTAFFRRARANLADEVAEQVVEARPKLAVFERTVSAERTMRRADPPFGFGHVRAAGA
jgi:hypothetical protein